MGVLLRLGLTGGGRKADVRGEEGCWAGELGVEEMRLRWRTGSSVDTGMVAFEVAGRRRVRVLWGEATLVMKSLGGEALRPIAFQEAMLMSFAPDIDILRWEPWEAFEGRKEVSLSVCFSSSTVRDVLAVSVGAGSLAGSDVVRGEGVLR